MGKQKCADCGQGKEKFVKAVETAIAKNPYAGTRAAEICPVYKHSQAYL